MKTVFLFLSGLFLLSANAQINPRSHTQKDSVYYKKPFLRLYPVIYNNGEHLQKDEVESLVSKAPEAEEFYYKYKRQFKSGIYSFAGVFIGAGLGAIAFDNGNKGLNAAGLILSFGSFVRSIVLLSSGEANLKRAIKAYNQSVN